MSTSSSFRFHLFPNPWLAGFALFCATLPSGAQSSAVNSFAWLGRVSDAERVAFDTNRVATLSAYSAGGALLARSTTFHRPNSRNNYLLEVPVASSAASGAAQVGDAVVISVVDDDGATWAGIVVDPGRESGTVVGRPGGVKEVDIALIHDADGDGFDDKLAEDYEAAWEFWRARQDEYDVNEKFDLDADHDGDGASTRSEILAGTYPFDAQSVLRIEAFDSVAGSGEGAGENAWSVTFPAVGGHAYSIESSDTPGPDGNWKPVEFRSEVGAAPVSFLSLPNAERTGRIPTVFLAPLEGKAAFFRVKVE